MKRDRRILVTLALALAVGWWAGWLGPARTQVGGPQTYVPTVGGTANAITATVPNVNSLNDLVGVPIRFVVASTNTASATINVSSTGATTIKRPFGAGGALTTLGGGEMVAGHIAEVMLDGTAASPGSEFVLLNSALPQPPGMVIDYAGAAGCPTGFVEANAGSFVTANFPALNTVLSTTWGGAGTLPDLRGRATFSRDSGGSGRITSPANFDGTVVGNTGGQQTFSILRTHLPNITFTNSGITLNDPGHTHSTGGTAGGAGTGFGNGSFASVTTTTSSSSTTGITVSSQGSAASGGSGTPLSVLSNAAIVLKCVRS